MAELPWVNTYGIDRYGKETGNSPYYHEGRDCAVRSTSLFLNIPYAEAHRMYSAVGRQDGFPTTISMIEKALGVEFKEYETFPTFNQWLKTHSKGTYLVVRTRHIFTVIDGVVHDCIQPTKLMRVRYTLAYTDWNPPKLKLKAKPTESKLRLKRKDEELFNQDTVKPDSATCA